jgi:hypothetical protein
MKMDSAMARLNMALLVLLIPIHVCNDGMPKPEGKLGLEMGEGIVGRGEVSPH